jgi:GNAT superfamily N-acetyltransferase
MTIQILSLTGNHNRKNFDCGRIELNLWLQQIARQHQEKGLSKTFVATLPETPEQILGYYALSLAELATHNLPKSWQTKFPRHIPAIRLGRLAVDKNYQKKGLGELLLMNAIEKAKFIHQQAGGIGLFVDAIDQQAAQYYLHYGFQAIPDNPLLLFFPIKN